jgi:hypothetical protein
MNQLLAALRQGKPLPQLVWIPAELDLKFSALWARSSVSPYHEWGATIIESEGGILTIGVEREGDDAGVSFLLALLAQPGCIGISHTHPYEDGTTDVVFAPQDIAEVVNRRLEISILQSGNTRFLIAQRVSETKPLVNVKDLEREMYDMVVDAMQDRTVTWQQALLAANLSVCRRLGLEFYRGEVRLTRLIGGD